MSSIIFAKQNQGLVNKYLPVEKRPHVLISHIISFQKKYPTLEDTKNAWIDHRECNTKKWAKRAEKNTQPYENLKFIFKIITIFIY